MFSHRPTVPSGEACLDRHPSELRITFTELYETGFQTKAELDKALKARQP
jgi:hypothetical protein